MPVLPEKYNANLSPNIRLKNNLLIFELEILDGETEENFITRAERLIYREIRRINVLEGRENSRIHFEKSEPKLKYSNVCYIPTGCAFLPVENPETAGLEKWDPDSNLEIKLLLWEKVHLTTDIRLIYVYLHLIWELSDLEQWDYKNKTFPDLFEEIPILRNLLMHANKPNPRVIAYLNIHKLGIERSIENVEAHLKLAAHRLPDIKFAMHRRILQGIGYPGATH